MFTLGCTCTGSSQAPAIEWATRYGGSWFDIPSDITVAPDGSTLVVGRTQSMDGDAVDNHGGYDAWAIKLDASGNLVWKKCFGGTGTDVFDAVEPAADGGYVMAGGSDSNDGDLSWNSGAGNLWVVKMSAEGNIIWQKLFGGSRSERALDIKCTNDGGYLVGSTTNSDDGDVSGYHPGFDLIWLSDGWVLKLDASGELEWQRAIGGSGADRIWGVQPCGAGGFLVAGDALSTDGDATGNHGGMDAWVVKLTDSGTVDWHLMLGGPGSDQAFDIMELSNGDIALAGNDGGFPEDAWVARLDPEGQTIWEDTYGGTQHDGAVSMCRTSSDGILLTGHSESDDGDLDANWGMNDVWVLAIDGGGTLEWQRSLGGSLTDYGACIAATPDQGLVVGCASSSGDHDLQGSAGSEDLWVVKFEGNGSGMQDRVAFGVDVSPTPATTSITVRTTAVMIGAQARLLDLLGREVRSTPIRHPSFELSVGDLPRGAYTLVISDHARSGVGRVILH